MSKNNYQALTTDRNFLVVIASGTDATSGCSHRFEKDGNTVKFVTDCPSDGEDTPTPFLHWGVLELDGKPKSVLIVDANGDNPVIISYVRADEIRGDVVGNG